MRSQLLFSSLRFACFSAAVAAAALVSPAAGAAAAPESDDPIRLDAFEVTSAVGRYAEDNTSAASKMPTSTREIPFSIQLFNAALISDHVAETIADLYPYVVGMNQESKNVNGFNLRGFSVQDGGTLQNIQFDNLPGPASRFGAQSTANVERMEVLEGPSSVLYGRLNPGGMINIVSKQPMQTEQNSVSVAATSYTGRTSPLGDDLGITTTVDSTGPLDQHGIWLYRIIGSQQTADSYRQGDYFRNYYLYPSFTFRPDRSTSFTVQFELVREKRRADDYLTMPPGGLTSQVPAINIVYQDPTDVDRDWGEVLSTVFKHEFADGWHLTFSTRSVSHGDSRHAFRSNQTLNTVLLANPVSNSKVQRFYQSRYIARGFNYFDTNAYREFGTENFKQTILAGAGGGIERSDANFYQNAASGPTVSLVNLYDPLLEQTPYPTSGALISPLNPKIHYYDTGLYLSDRLKFWGRLNLLIGGRYDHERGTYFETYTRKRLDDSVGAALPYAGVLFDLTDHITSYASWSVSVKPQPLDGPVDSNGRNDFPDQKGSQIEIGTKAQLLNNTLTPSVALYDIKKKNVVQSIGQNTASGFGIGQLVGEQESKGIELQLAWLPVPNWEVQLGGTYIDARIKESFVASQVGSFLVDVPPHSASLWTRYNFTAGGLKGFGVGMGTIYEGPRLGGSVLTQSGSFTMAAYTRFDTALFYQFRRYRFSLNVTNALDRYYLASTSDNALFPGDPRKITIDLRTKF